MRRNKRSPKLFNWFTIACSLLALGGGAWLGYDAGYSDGWNGALTYADGEDMRLRGVDPIAGRRVETRELTLPEK